MNPVTWVKSTQEYHFQRIYPDAVLALHRVARFLQPCSLKNRIETPYY